MILEDVKLTLYIIVAVILCYIPALCYWDIRYREIPHHIIWVPMFLVGTSITSYNYISGSYPLDSLVVSIVMVATFYWMYLREYLQGADFMFLTFISAFWVINPFPVPHGLMQIMFYIYLLVFTLITAGLVLAYNIWKGNRWGLKDMVSTFPGGVPYVLTISAAFLVSLVIG